MSTFLGSAASQALMLTLTGRPGDYCTRTDIKATFVLAATDPTIAANWYQLLTGIRTSTVTSSTTLTPNADTDEIYAVTALAVGTTIGSPSGTPINGQMLTVRIKDNGTGQTLAWNAAWRPMVTALPITTVSGQTLYVRALWNSIDSRWDVLTIASA